MRQPVVVGWRERVSLPDWGIEALAAKIDTGARTSAIHVENIELGEDQTISFEVILNRREHHRRVPITTKWTRKARIRSSTGEVQERFVVTTRMILGDVEKEIELSLVSRQNMIIRMLLGRTGLEDDFVVDASAKYLTSK